MDLDQLRAFVAVVDHGSFVTAAEALQLARSTLRERVEALEESLGLTLLVRTHRGTQATEAGREFVDRARRVLQEIRSLAEFSSRPDEPTGIVRARAPAGMPPAWTALFICEIHRRFPKLALHLETSSQPVLTFPPELDILLTLSPHLPSGPLRTFVLTRAPIHLLASRDYLDTTGRPTSLHDLQHHPLMAWVSPGEDGRRWPLRSGGNLDVQPFLATDDIYMLRNLVSAGQGIALLPDHSLATGVPGETLELVLPELVGGECVVRVVIPEAFAGSPRSHHVAELLRAIVSGMFGKSLDALETS